MYSLIKMPQGKPPKTFRIHRLVAEAFLSNPKRKKFVNHKDGNKENNVVTNLEWVTKREDSLHAYSTGLRKAGNFHWSTKILDEEIPIILHRISRGDLQKDIARDYGVHPVQITEIKQGNRFVLRKGKS